MGCEPGTRISDGAQYNDLPDLPLWKDSAAEVRLRVMVFATCTSTGDRSRLLAFTNM